MLYADDLALVAETRRGAAAHMLEVLDEACTRWDICICKCQQDQIVQVRTGEHQPTSEQPITLQEQTLENQCVCVRVCVCVWSVHVFSLFRM